MVSVEIPIAGFPFVPIHGEKHQWNSRRWMRRRHQTIVEGLVGTWGIDYASVCGHGFFTREAFKA